jgi:acetyl-CoA carboxylase biotin carboxyl carrier protein
MDEAKLKRLIRLVEESDIDELEIDRPLGRIRITKRRAAEPMSVVTAPAAVAPTVLPAEPAPTESGEREPAPVERDSSLVAIVAHRGRIMEICNRVV